MNLPEVPRVIYKKTSLREVICQFRFPPILKIGVSEPADFQEEIRQRFPIYRLRQETETLGIPEQFKEIILPKLPKSYDFLDESENSLITLTRDFLAISTKSYDRFENFIDIVDLALKALNKTYDPNFFTRIGLRYIDVINRDFLNIKEINWNELLDKCFAGELAGDLSENIAETKSESIYIFEWGALHCQHGLREIGGEGKCYLIDNDFFKDTRTNYNEIQEILRRFNEYERKFLRHCITEKLHIALEPTNP
jgi:uncharacterized protein (TIGR04255 family)